MKSKVVRRIRRNRRSPFVASRYGTGFFGGQAKLSFGQPGDEYEVEADRVADAVVKNSDNQPFFSPGTNGLTQNKDGLIQEKLAETVTPLVQKQEEEEEMMQMQPIEEEEEMLQAQSIVEEEEMMMGETDPEEEEMLQGQPLEEEEEMLQSQAFVGETGSIQKAPEDELESLPSGDSMLESRLSSASNSGQKLDDTVKSEMETGFGSDFSHVNIHTDSKAVQMNKEIGAQAFTHGNDIYFNQGKYNPNNVEGKHLLAHELTHTIQQKGMVPLNLQMTIGDNHDLTSARFSGNLILEACYDGEQTLQVGSSGQAVTLMQQALVDAGFPLPQFGVDGIFGNETRSALQDFQRSSTLTANGILNVATISALDALFTGGVPSLPPAVPVVPPPGTPPAVTSETIRSAPDGSPDTRTTVGVGERVRFTSNTAGTWTVSDGRIIGNNNGANMVWEAPPVATSPTITITTPGGTRVVPFTVIAPNNLTMVVGNRHPIAAGTAGACMLTNVTVNPLNVNFGRTQWLEVPGPASNVSGYFTRFAAATIFHHPNPNYLPFNDSNTGLSDHAAWHAVPGPFSFGTFEWVIPNRYKIDGEADAQGRVFTNTVQAFTMFSGGTMMINKAGATVIRFINNLVF